MRAKVFADPTVECAESVRRGKAAFEQEAHWIAFVTKGRLHTDEDIAEMRAVDVDV